MQVMQKPHIKMLFTKFSFVFVALLLYFGDTANAQSRENCSFITSQYIKLSILDLEDVQIKSALYLNVSELKNQTVDEFLHYLKNVQNMSLSSHTASVRSMNLAKDVSPFTTIPLMTPLCQVIDVWYNVSIADRQYTLFVGVELTPQQALMKRFSKGLVIDNHTGLFKMGILSPVIFDKSYQPVEELPTPSIVFEKHIIKTAHNTNSTAFNQNEVSSEISTLITSVKTEYLKEKNVTSKDTIITSYAVVSLLNKKTGLYIDERKIDLDPSFIDELYSIVDKEGSSPYNRTKLVVKVLNRYGWYVPNQFTLGGRLDVVKSLNELSDSNKIRELEALELKLGAAYNAFTGSKKGSSSVNTKSSFSSNERVTSTVDQAMDIASFMKNIEIKENWQIIASDNIVPTCKFLLRKHSGLFAEIRRLIINNAHRQNISNLQPYIDIVQYMNNLWDAYIPNF